jgi:predicted NUDIX family NTP pyrophosphohydrolase
MLYRQLPGGPEFFLVHPGGPFWSKKDAGAWSIPKGLVEAGEDSLTAALREFAEETGSSISGDASLLGSFKQPSGKLIDAWLMEGPLELAGFRSNSFQLEWPPRSGTLKEFPEVDQWGWFTPVIANDKIVRGQRPILAAAVEHIHRSAGS